MNTKTFWKSLQRFTRTLECPIDEDAGYKNDRWTNRDLIPIPPERRTWTIASFFIYWSVSGFCISAYSIGASLLAYGLSAKQAIVCVLVGSVLSGLLAVVAGMPGEIHHVGFTVICRMTWGMRGGYFPIVLRTFSTIFWFGIQSYWGGQAVSLMLGALSPHFRGMTSSLPPSAHITTQDLIGVILWYLFYIPLILVPPERLQRPFFAAFAMFTCTVIGLLAWSVSKANGTGPMFHVQNTASSTSFSMLLGISSVLGSWGAGTLHQSDWVRYARRRHYPIFAQLIAAPTSITICALLGVIITSASAKVLGKVIWSPIQLLGAVQDHYASSSGVRAAVFFAGLGCTCAQLSINVLLNSVSAGMDLAGLWPRMINIRRGAYILAALGLASNPWQILTSASVFLSVISGFGIFYAPLTGILVADYLVVRQRRLKVEDLYIGNPSSIYWFHYGFNWRPFVAFGLGVWFFVPGFVITLRHPKSPSKWVKLFRICFLVGFSIGFLAMIILSYLFPVSSQRDGLPYLDDDRFNKSVGGGNDVINKTNLPISEDIGQEDSEKQIRPTVVSLVE